MFRPFCMCVCPRFLCLSHGRTSLGFLLALCCFASIVYGQTATEILLQKKSIQAAGNQNQDDAPLSATEELLKLKAQREGRVWQRQGDHSTQRTVLPAISVVDARGLAPWYAKDPARSKEEALEAAFRDAVQQVSGVALSSETEVQNFSLVRDEILTKTKGFVKSYEIISEKRTDNVYEVALRATTSPQAFVDEVGASLSSLYERVGRPRMLMAIQSNAKEDYFRPVERILRKKLIKQGFILVDLNQNTPHQRSALLAAASKQGVELLFIGENQLGKPTQQGAVYVYEATVGADVLRVDNGQVIAAEVALGYGKDSRESQAILAAFGNATEKLLQSVAGQVTYAWISEKQGGSRVEIEISSIRLDQAATARRILANRVKGVKRVSQRSFLNNQVVLEAWSTSPSSKLADAIHGMAVSGGFLQVSGISANRILVEFQKK